MQSQSMVDGNPDIRVTSSYAAILADELAQIERIVGDSIGKLKVVVEQGVEVAKTEKETTDQVISALKTEVESANGKIAALEAKAGEMEAELRLKNAAIAEVEQSARLKLAQIEGQLRAKEAQITDGDRQILTLKSEVERLKEGMLEMASFVTMRTKIIADGNAIPRTRASTEMEMTAPAQPSYAQLSDRPADALFDR